MNAVWYLLAPVGRGNREYLVADVEDFVSVRLDMSVPASPFRAHPHVTKRVTLGDGEVHYPVKAEYERKNGTLEGREQVMRPFLSVNSLLTTSLCILN